MVVKDTSISSWKDTVTACGLIAILFPGIAQCADKDTEEIGQRQVRSAFGLRFDVSGLLIVERIKLV